MHTLQSANGSIILSFGAGFQSEGTSAPDLFCWEYGGTAESYTVSVSSDGISHGVDVTAI